jgi:hypothetical protein
MGGIGDFFSSVFGDSSQKTKDLVNNLKPQKVYGFADEPNFNTDYLTQVKNRMAGRDVGYDQSVLNAATAPYAQAERQGYYGYTVPTTEARASAAGLGRSTIPLNQIRTGGQEVESSIGKKVADITLANEQQKRSEINDALTRYYTYTKDDLVYKNMQSQADYANYLAQIGYSQQADQVRNAILQKATMAIGGGIAGVAGLASGNPMLAMSGFGSMTSGLSGTQNNSQTMDMTAYLQKLMGGNASTVQK